MTFREWLEKRGACWPALQWVGTKTLAQAWAECPRGEWMRWLSAAVAQYDLRGDWSFTDHLRMANAWANFFDVEVLKAYDQNPKDLGLGGPDADEWYTRRDQLYCSLQASFYRSIQPSPPPIAELEG